MATHMMSVNFENTRRFREFFAITDDMPIVTAERTIFEWFLDRGIEVRVWMSAAGWVVQADDDFWAFVTEIEE